MPSNTEAGKYTLEKFAIISEGVDRDLKLEFKTWGLNESMNSPFIYGYVTIVDSNNSIRFLTGKEELEIIYVDYYGERRTERYVIYSVNQLKPVSEKDDQVVQFTLEFCSREKFISDSYRIQKAYVGRIDEIATTLFDEFYVQPRNEWDSFNDVQGKELTVIEPTSGAYNLIIPNMRPDEAMNFLTKRAYSDESPSLYFRFWETRDGFNFSTFENMIFEKYSADENIPVFTYNMMAEATPEAQQFIMNNMLSIDFGDRVDTMMDMKSGAYKMRVTELDIINRTPVVYEYNHIESYPDILTPSTIRLNHDQDFVDKYLSESQNLLVIKDYFVPGTDNGIVSGDLRENMYYPEIFTKKSAIKYHGDRHKVVIKIYGRNKDIYAGGMVELKLKKFKYKPAGKEEDDIEYSGYYVIESVNHIFDKQEYTATLTLTKYGIGDGV